MQNRFVPFTWSCAFTILLGAFLLFQVQPVISKMILPWFGGGPAVWTVCMLFFQVMLLAGYAYAHYAIRLRSPLTLLLVHLSILVAAALLLPITPSPDWKPSNGNQPTARILALLAVNVGLPYFVLATTGPLVQAWYHRVTAHPSPYRFYALSNLGSLSALLTFPFLFEPNLTTNAQGSLWSWLFALFAVLCGALAIYTFLAARSPQAATTASIEPSTSSVVPVDHRMVWLFLPLLASTLLLAITNHVCQDVAVVPFLWVVPLSLYLLSFILCFESSRWYRRRLIPVFAVVAVLAVSVVELDYEMERLLAQISIDVDISDYTSELSIEAAIYLVLLFLTCMICHGEVVRVAPAAEQLTAFYLMIAAGGAGGGILVALVCPQVFSSYIEMSVGIIAAFMLAVGVLWDDLWHTRLLRSQAAKWIAMVLAFPLLFVVVRSQFEAAATGDDLERSRNFYGVLAVEEHHVDDEDSHILELYNGRILHGSQFVREAKRSIPTTYYSPESGIGLTMQRLRRGPLPMRVAVVGLGTGTIATYGRDGDYFCFYEINPNVERMANTYFTFLSDSAASIEIVMGDARLSMESRDSQSYDILVLDAFSGDAIPAHLLTQEAFAEYAGHMATDSVIALHISNRHLDLTPVVGGLAEHFGWKMIRVEFQEKDRIGEASSDWILLTRNEAFLADPVVKRRSVPVEFEPIRPWTDQYSNLFQIMMW